MSLRRRSKPVLAASAVARAKSRADEKSISNKKVSEDVNNVVVDEIQCQTSTSVSEEARVSNPDTARVSNPDTLKGPEPISNQSNMEKETKEAIAKNDEISKTDLNASLTNRKRFTKVRPTPNLSRKKVKLEKTGETDTNEKNLLSNEKNVLNNVSGGNSETLVGNEACRGLYVDEKDTLEIDKEMKKFGALDKCPLDEVTDNLNDKFGDNQVTNEKSLPDNNADISKQNDKMSHSGFIVADKEIADTSQAQTLLDPLNRKLKENKMSAKTDNSKNESHERNEDILDALHTTQNSPLCKIKADGKDVTPKATRNEPEKDAAVSSIKGRFKKSRFTPNVGKSKTKVDDTTCHDKQNEERTMRDNLEAINTDDQKTEDKSSNSDQVEAAKSNKLSSKRFRRSSIKPNIASTTLAKSKLNENNDENTTEITARNINKICDDIETVKVPVEKQIAEIKMNIEAHSFQKQSEFIKASSRNLKINNPTCTKGGESDHGKCQGESTQIDNFDTKTIECNESPPTLQLQKEDSKDNESKVNDQGKKTRRFSRGRFTPNIKVTEKKIVRNDEDSNSLQKNDQTVQLNKIDGSYLNKDCDSKEGSLEKNLSEKENLPKKHVRFTPNVGQKWGKGDAGKVDDATDVEMGDSTFNQTKQSESEEVGKKEEQNSSLSTSHSDIEEGSQSESEGLSHHGKRKFAPCLGPRVRQRRRMSSMTLSEDEGGAAERSVSEASDKNPVVAADKSTNDDAVKVSKKGKEGSSKQQKAKKRTRIVIKEPKEKMTMFDYIYYNPQSSEKDKAENEGSSTGKKQRQDEANVLPETETILETLGTGTGGPVSEPATSGNNDDNLAEEDDNQVLAPQIRIGEDGNIIIDEESLVLKTTRSKMSIEETNVLYDDGNPFNPYRRRREPTNNKKRWPVNETLKFYRALSRVGTDFSLMVQFFPDCTRRNLKQKFKTEEKFNGDLIDRALKHMLPMDTDLLNEIYDCKNGGNKESQAIEEGENPTTS